MVGLQVGRRGVGPCPACNATRRGRADPRPPIGLRPDQRGWRCHACGAQGDGLDLAAWVVRGSRLRDLNNEGCRAVVGALGAYETGDMPIFSDIGFPSLPSGRPHLDGLKATWDGAHPVTSDEGAVNWLRGRGLDPERIVDLDLARALHAEPPRWARCLGLGWLQGWRLLLPAYDAEGVLRSLRGRWVSTSFPPENTKVVSPRGKLGQHPLRTRCQHRAEKWTFKTGNFVNSSPAVSDGVVYVGSDDHLYAVDANTGKQKWTFQTGGPLDSSPAISDGVVYVGSWDNTLYALDAHTGQEKWTFKTGGKVTSSPAVSDGVVYVGSNDHNLYAVDAHTGQEKWTFKTGGRVYSSPAVSDGVVYVGSDDHSLYALDANTGQQKWTFKTGSFVFSSPAVSDGVVYVGSYDHTLYALE